MALKIPMTFAQYLLSTIMETAFLFVSRIWKPRCLKKHRVGRREPTGLVIEDPRVDVTGGAAATMPGIALGGLTGAGYMIASASVVNAGTVAGDVVVSGGVVAGTATDVEQVLLGGAYSNCVLFAAQSCIFLLHNCALIIIIVFFCIYAYTMHIKLHFRL